MLTLKYITENTEEVILRLSKKYFDGREEYYHKLPLPSQVKRLGKYLKDNLTGVYKVQEPPNEYIIYTTLLYHTVFDKSSKRHTKR